MWRLNLPSCYAACWSSQNVPQTHHRLAICASSSNGQRDRRRQWHPQHRDLASINSAYYSFPFSGATFDILLASLCHCCSTISQPFLLALPCRSHSFEGPCIYSVRFLSESPRAYLIPCCLLDVILLYRQCILHNRNRRADTILFCTITAVLYAAILFVTLFQSAAKARTPLWGWQSIRMCLELYSERDYVCKICVVIRSSLLEPDTDQGIGAKRQSGRRWKFCP